MQGAVQAHVFADFFQEFGAAAFIAEEDFGRVAGGEVEHEEDGDGHEEDGRDGLEEAAGEVFAHGTLQSLWRRDPRK